MLVWSEMPCLACRGPSPGYGRCCVGREHLTPGFCPLIPMALRLRANDALPFDANLKPERPQGQPALAPKARPLWRWFLVYSVHPVRRDPLP